MLTSPNVVGSPDWWLCRLGKGLSGDQSTFTALQQYYSGDHPLPFGNKTMRAAYERFQRMARSNYCGLVVSAVCERLTVEGFYAGGIDSQTDSAAFDIWQANSLDAESDLVHHTAASLGRAYVIVGPPDPTDPETPDIPVISVESPFNVYHEPDPVRANRVKAAIKTYFDSIRNLQLAVLYLPDAVYYYQANRVGKIGVAWDPKYWDIDDSEFENGAAPNSLGIVPVVPFINRKSMQYPLGFSEFGDVIDIQDRINSIVLDELVIANNQSFRQRYAIGLTVDDENGSPQRPYDPGADMLWVAQDENVKFGDFEQSDIGPIIQAIESHVGMLGNISRTPPQMLTGQLVNVSGDALVVAESGLVGKIKNRQISYGESWERVVRIAGMYGTVNVSQDAAIQWSNPELYSLASKSQAMVLLQSAGVPFRERMEVFGYSPSKIDRMEAERVKDALLASLNNPMSVDPGISASTVTLAGGDPGQPVVPQDPDAPDAGQPAIA